MPAKEKTPDQIRDELAGIAGEVLQSSESFKGPASKAVGEIRDLIDAKSNSGWVFRCKRIPLPSWRLIHDDPALQYCCDGRSQVLCQAGASERHSRNCKSPFQDITCYLDAHSLAMTILSQPSACLNGIFEPSVSSSWTDEQWNEYFK
jgi:hypothetical protein